MRVRSVDTLGGNERINNKKKEKTMETTPLKVSARSVIGKGAARECRRQGMIPGVVYGDKKTPTMFQMEPKELVAEMHKKGFKTRVFDMDIDGKKEQCICQDVQMHPVKDTPLHADFLRVNEKKEIKLSVPVHFLNQSACRALKQGGTLSVIRRTVDIIAKIANVPSELTVDLTGLEFGANIHVQSIELPEGVRLADDKINFTVATLIAPRISGGAADAEATEGEETETTEDNKE